MPPKEVTCRGSTSVHPVLSQKQRRKGWHVVSLCVAPLTRQDPEGSGVSHRQSRSDPATSSGVRRYELQGTQASLPGATGLHGQPRPRLLGSSLHTGGAGTFPAGSAAWDAVACRGALRPISSVQSLGFSLSARSTRGAHGSRCGRRGGQEAWEQRSDHPEGCESPSAVGPSNSARRRTSS